MAQRVSSRRKRRRRRRSIMEAVLSIAMVLLLVAVLVICIWAMGSCGDNENDETGTDVTTSESASEDSTTVEGDTTTGENSSDKPTEEATTEEQETTTEKATDGPSSGVISPTYGDQICNDGKFIVCIDPGHGGRDGGTSNGDRLEKDDALRLAFAVKKEMEALGIEVVMTRDTDVWVDKDQRPLIANAAKADVLISLHRNSYSKSNVVGYEAWIASEANSNSADLARAILKGLQESGISKNRGVKEGTSGNSATNYYINSLSSMPSMILELGYMSSDSDNQLYDAKLNDHAKVIADTIYAWLNEN